MLEREDVPGGRAGRLTRDGFTFDTGPTVLTMPELIDRPLRAAGSSLEERLELTVLDPAYRGFFADGSTLDVRHGHEAMREEIRRECGEDDAGAFDEFVPWLERLALRRPPGGAFVPAGADRLGGLGLDQLLKHDPDGLAHEIDAVTGTKCVHQVGHGRLGKGHR